MAQKKRSAKRPARDSISVNTAPQTRGFGSPRPVSVQLLSDHVNVFIGQIGTVLSQAPEHVSHYHLAEITISVEVSAKGELSIMGTGFGAGAKGGLSFVFKREP